MLAVAAPMATELAGIRRAVREPQGRGVAFYVTGVGRAATEAGFARIVAERPDAALLVGFCGGADPELRAGDLHIAAAFRHGSKNGCVPADGALSAAILDAARRSGIRAVNQPSETVNVIADAAFKTELHRSNGVVSVNMEDYWAATAAAASGVPFASVRVVLDTAGQSLPDYLAERDVHPAGVALNAAIRPGRLPALVKLGRQSHLARRNLTRCVLAAIDALDVRPPSLAGVTR